MQGRRLGPCGKGSPGTGIWLDWGRGRVARCNLAKGSESALHVSGSVWGSVRTGKGGHRPLPNPRTRWAHQRLGLAGKLLKYLCRQCLKVGSRKVVIYASYAATVSSKYVPSHLIVCASQQMCDFGEHADLGDYFKTKCRWRHWGGLNSVFCGNKNFFFKLMSHMITQYIICMCARGHMPHIL